MLTEIYRVVNEDYQQLYNRWVELKGFAIQHPTISFMLRAQFEAFRSRNSLHLQIILDREERLRVAHCIPVPEKPGQYELEILRNGSTVFKYRSEVDRLAYEKEWSELMKTKIN